MTPNIRVFIVRKKGRKFLYMRYKDPETGIEHTRSTKATTLRDAERAAAKWEAELNSGRWKPPHRMTFAEFRERYEKEKLAGLSDGYNATMHTVFEHWANIIGDEILISRVNPEVVSRYQAGLRGKAVGESTIRTYLKHLKAALAWAADLELINAVPKIPLPAHARTRSRMKGRPISDAEFQLMLTAAEQVRPADHEEWKRHLTGLWLSGLRLGESLRLSWDEHSDFAVDLFGRRPRFRIQAEGQKARRDELLPMTPDFATWLLTTPTAERVGQVFRPGGYEKDKVMRVISDIGKTAGINVTATKHATAHDLRRSFGTRWSMKVRPAVLQKLMRHRDIATTMSFYVSHEADDIADELWSDFEE